MRRIREVLRLKFELDRSQREIAAATGLSKGSVSKYLARAQQHEVTWVAACELSDSELEAKLFTAPRNSNRDHRLPVDPNWVQQEMRKKGVTLQLLWVEYREAARHDQARRLPYQYSQFCILHRELEKRVDVVMRQVHLAGEKCFIGISHGRLGPRDRGPQASFGVTASNPASRRAAKRRLGRACDKEEDVCVSEE